jgi:hypothetical protein
MLGVSQRFCGIFVDCKESCCSAVVCEVMLSRGHFFSAKYKVSRSQKGAAARGAKLRPLELSAIYTLSKSFNVPELDIARSVLALAEINSN